MDTGYNTIMDTVCKNYGPYIKLTWTDIGCNQLDTRKFEVFAHMQGNNITAHFSNGKKLNKPSLECEEGCWELHFTETDNNDIERNRDEFVDEIEESSKTEFERAASSNKENKKSFKF